MDSAAAIIQAQQLAAEAAKNDPRAKARYEDFSVWSDVLGFLPDNVKAYIKSNLGLGKDLSELDLNEKTLNYLDYLAFGGGAQDPNRIAYEDYGKNPYASISRDPVGQIIDIYKNAGVDLTREEVLANKDDYTIKGVTLKELEKQYPGILTPEGLGLGSFIDPAEITKTFIGKGRIVRDENGNAIVQDMYNFNEPESVKEYYKEEDIGLGQTPLYEGLRRFSLYNPLFTEFPVNINLGKKEDYINRRNRLDELYD